MHLDNLILIINTKGEPIMKGLTQFQYFDSEHFFKDKVLVVTGISPWTDFSTKDSLGTKVQLTIIEDNTQYLASSDGSKICNRFEKFTVKVHNPAVVNVEINDIVKIAKPIAKVYGEYHNMLSVVAENVIKLK